MTSPETPDPTSPPVFAPVEPQPGSVAPATPPATPSPAAPAGYATQPPGYATQQPGYATPPSAYATQPSAYATQPSAYATQHPGYAPQQPGMFAPAPQLPGTNPLAIVAICLWVLPFFGSIGSVVTGHIAVSQISKRPQGGKSLAIVGLILGYLSFVFSIIFLVFAMVGAVNSITTYGSGSTTYSDNYTDSQTAASTKLAVGDCFNDISLDQSSEKVPNIACSSEHDDEVYAIVDLPALAKYPGDNSLSKITDSFCAPLFEKFVGTGMYDTNLNFSTVYPSETSWKKSDRQALCYAYDVDDTTKGSLKGKGSQFPTGINSTK